jgi:hypothetical protein
VLHSVSEINDYCAIHHFFFAFHSVLLCVLHYTFVKMPYLPADFITSFKHSVVRESKTTGIAFFKTAISSSKVHPLAEFFIYYKRK